MEYPKIYRWISRKKYYIGIFLVCSMLFYYCLPQQLFHEPYSTVLEASNGKLMSASIAKDGQWRFPETDLVSDKFYKALITFEDKRFYHHPGVDPLSFARAVKQNVSRGEVVSGASTITMQVIRLSRKGKSRNIFEKAIEMVLATRLELRCSKEEILRLYAAHAPFGGNVVGVDAACWRYFGRSAKDLSWGEAALLAVLPNSPSLIHPGKNRDHLLKKRNALIDRLYQAEMLDELAATLAKEEPLPDKPFPLPQYARHLLARTATQNPNGSKVVSTIDYDLQLRVEQILADRHRILSGNEIHNAAAIVADVKTGNVLAYVGNVVNPGSYHGDDVDIIQSPRSTGSILKPFLFAAMLDEGKILSRTILPDIPTYINGFTPKNFSKQYDGAVAADQALIRSLNIPAVYQLKQYKYERFHHLLTSLGMSTLTRPPDHYGLALILGGAEGTLWEITGMYASMARTLNNFDEHPGKNKYAKADFHPLTYLLQDSTAFRNSELSEKGVLNAGAIYQTFDALVELSRPGEESGWKNFFSAKKIAWKTGTSFGFRDGWAVGVTPDYVIGIWVGNADGEGRPGLTGTDAAAPILFDIFSQLPGDRWFTKPQQELFAIPVCAKSGYRTTDRCDDVDTIYVTEKGLQSSPCPYHQRVQLTKDHKFRVHSACEALSKTETMSWFVLPPITEYYYRPHDPTYKTLPPFRTDCASQTTLSAMDLIYPKPHARMYIPRDLNGEPGQAVFHLAHRNPAVTVFWHLDGTFIGKTLKSHHMAVNPAEGSHTLTLIDEKGEVLEQKFEILSKM
ncbi:penicillin-binding protein 1C [Pseudochryseolinea flava]|uniref:peptidoglycan glycosyltransferase n=1 Tax=Pseudochryseolinea flava TaxID=2059302 RepID=A0A364XY81_9BACT|nr:penicillin-binding protein 1C [Pseudochryseolinea flava]RAV99396.1 penicillin-binding protein 1C [Pseudochryseolinea flava]